MSGHRLPGSDFLYKVILVGDSGVGKSNILSRFVNGKKLKDPKTTIGVDVSFKTLSISCEPVSVQIWDTAGQEKYMSMSKLYYRETRGVFVVFDLTRRCTFEHIPIWLAEIQEHAQTSSALTIPIAILGNKHDRADRAVFHSDIEKLRETVEFSYFETSAETNYGITEAFSSLLLAIHIQGLKSYYASKLKEEQEQCKQCCVIL